MSNDLLESIGINPQDAAASESEAPVAEDPEVTDGQGEEPPPPADDGQSEPLGEERTGFLRKLR